MDNNTQNTWNRQQLHPGSHRFSSSKLRRKFWQLIWSSNIRCRVCLGKADHTKHSAPYGKTSAAFWTNWIQRQPRGIAVCLCSISHRACDFTQVLEFLIITCYSIYFYMQILPLFLVEMPCTKAVLPLWKLGGFTGFVFF